MHERGRFMVGWAEWVTLPDLGLPAIKAKVDTGARTSALHAFQIEPFGPASAPMVRFGVHPIPGRTDVTVFSSAPLLDRREVTSSNGERETRCVITTNISMGGRTWPIEVTLANRGTMAYRMLLGRQAIRGDMQVNPAASYLQPKLGYRLYHNLPQQETVHRPLRFALLTRHPRVASSQHLSAAAAERGHVLEPVDAARLSILLDSSEPRLSVGKTVLGHYDAVIPRVRAEDGSFGAAAVRQLELTGSFALNTGDALDRLLNTIATQQHLARHRVPTPARALREANTSESAPESRPKPPILRFLVIGGEVISIIQRRNGKADNAADDALDTERRIAERAAQALDLGLASVDIAEEDNRPVVVKVSGAPALQSFEALTGVHVADAVIAAVERRVQSWRRTAQA